jgi:small-conductance mechanosensitive channel
MPVEFSKEALIDLLVNFGTHFIKAIIIIIILRVALSGAEVLINGVLSSSNSKHTFYLKERRIKTLNPLLKSIVTYVLYFFGAAMILDEFGVPMTSVIATAGLASLAVGFGAQNLVRDVITGFFIVFEDHFAVGDYVSLAGVSGIVEDMGLRATRIRDFGGQLYIIPNGEIKQVTNYMGEKMRVLVDVSVSQRESIDRVMGVLDNVIDDMKQHGSGLYVEGPSILGISRLGDVSFDIQIVAKTKAMSQWAAERDIRARVKQALDEAGIELPVAPRNTYVQYAMMKEGTGKS